MIRRVPPLIVVLMFGVGMARQARLAPVHEIAFPGRSLVAGLLSLTGLAVMVLAVQAFRRAQTTVNPLNPASASVLVTDGIFRLSRNPMYLGMAILLLAETVYLGSLFGPLWIVGFMLFINQFQIKPEEKALRDLFGSAFEDYCRRTRRWL